MAIKAKERHRSRQTAAILSADVTVCLLCCVSMINAYHVDLEETMKKIEKSLEENSFSYKGTGCVLPRIDEFSSETSEFEAKMTLVKCEDNKDWVKCYNSNCKIVREIEDTVKGITCEIRDIIYHSDTRYTLGPAKMLVGHERYELKLSDHIKVECTGTSLDGNVLSWSGNALGFRPVATNPSPPGRDVMFNVLVVAFDTASRYSFIKLMPKSWKVLTEELGATVMEGYNIVGEATAASIIPILTGHTELELPEARRNQPNSRSVDAYPFIFYKLRTDGYRTAYFEDNPYDGMFQWRLKGWLVQPTDHYLRAFSLEQEKKRMRHCVGDTPQPKFLMNITEQFMKLNGKKFAFTLFGLTHDTYNMAQTLDEDMAAFLRAFLVHSDDTLLVVMSDHGPRCPRYKPQCNDIQRKFEERQPLMALRLPAVLLQERPAAAAALQANARALTTPHDVHATLLDVLEMTEHQNPYRVPGADLPRALTMLEPIPRSRSCSDAGIELHWCACVSWQNVTSGDQLYDKTAHALLDFINNKEEEAGTICDPRTLRSVSWVRREQPNPQLLTYSGNADSDGFISAFDGRTRITGERYETRIVVGPAHDVIEALLTYNVDSKKFLIKNGDILWINSDWVCPSALSDFLFIVYDWHVNVLNRTGA